MSSFVENLRYRGATVDEGTLPRFSFTRATEIMNLLVRGETATRMSDEAFQDAQSLAREGPSRDDDHGHRNARGVALSHRDWLRLHEERQQIRLAWRQYFSSYDAFLCLVSATAAPSLVTGRGILERTVDVNGRPLAMLDQHFWSAIASLPYLPSVVMPIGETDGGMPVGLQVVGPAFHDLRVIALVELIREQIRMG